MDQPGSSNLPAQFVPSLQVGDFMDDEPSGQSSNSLPMPFDAGRPLGTFGLQVFCNNADDPWSLLNTPSNGQVTRYNPVAGPYYRDVCSFSDYRSGGLPSECGTLPPDSGYGSHRPQHSVASTSSVHEDDGTLDYQLTERFGHLGAENPQLTPHLLSQSELKHFCPDCETWVRTKSELNKHIQRHRKPYLCPHQNCPRRGEGFSTRNDLSRHKKSVHKEHEGNGHVYVCREGPCAEKNKLWPRADNFRQHLTRVHQREVKAEDDLSAYISKSSPLREDLKGVGSSIDHLDHQSRPQQLSDPPDLFPNANANQRTARQLYQASRDVPELLAGLSWAQLSVATDMSSQRSENTYNPSSSEPSQVTRPGIPADSECIAPEETRNEDRQDGLSTGKAHLQSSPDSMEVYQAPESPINRDPSIELDIYEAIDLPEETDVVVRDESTIPTSDVAGKAPKKLKHDVLSEPPDSIPTSLAGTGPGDLMKYLALIPKELLETALKDRELESKEHDSPDDKMNSKPQNQCAECAKTFNRPCELKKHIKRHEKPYGCTFRDCQKEFGSKNDWKRHESSQHYQLETWNCEEEGCKKVCHRREGFKNHLQRDHGLDNVKALEEKLERCRMGRHCDPRFWCGFCVDIVEIREPGVNSWMKRCDHIDNHLMGKEGLEKKRSSDWKYMEDQQAQYSPEPRVQVANTSSIPTSNLTKTTGRRRKASLDGNSQPSKRSKVAPIYTMWRCHICVGCVNNLKTTTNCLDCNHQWCSDCDVEAADLEEDGNGQMIEESTARLGDDQSA